MSRHRGTASGTSGRPASGRAGDVLKTDLLSSLGYASEHDALLRVIEEAGLSNISKRRISNDKRGAVAALLERRFIRVCGRGDCREAAAADSAGRRAVAATAPSFCESCLGSPARRAGLEMTAACRAAGWTRMVVVGGSPNTREEICRILADLDRPPDFRLVDGTRSRTRNEARADLEWADRVVLWGSTQLDHKVSTLYSAAKKCTTVPRRGVKALFEHIVEAAGPG